MTIKGRCKDAGKLIIPLVKAGINVPTLGFGGAIIEILQVPPKERWKRNINSFVKQTIKKINDLDIAVSEEELKKRIHSPEFHQILWDIIDKMKNESRAKIRQAYANLIARLLRDDPRINFDRKLFYYDILATMNEDHIKLLSIFYLRGDTKSSIFSLDALHKKTGCYQERKRRPGDPADISEFFDGKKKSMITALNELKASYFEGLLTDLTSKRLIKLQQNIDTQPIFKEEGDVGKEVESIETHIDEKYVGTELGKNFFDSIKSIKNNKD